MDVQFTCAEVRQPTTLPREHSPTDHTMNRLNVSVWCRGRILLRDVVLKLRSYLVTVASQ